MDIFKLKISIGDINIDLKGDSQTVHKIFTELRENGIGLLASTSFKFESEENNVKNIEERNEEISGTTLENPDVETEWPTLHHVVKSCSPKQESEWILIYAAYTSNKGEELFSLEQIRQKYRDNNRYTESNKKNFTKNVKRLLQDKYIQAINENEYRIEKSGLKLVESIVKDTRDTGKKTRKPPSKKSPTNFNILNLNLSSNDKDNLNKFWNSHEHKSGIDKAVLVSYWLREVKKINEITVDHFFTILKTLNENTAFKLDSTLNNAKNLNKYLNPGVEPKSYILNHIGEGRVTTLGDNFNG